jgi:predicted RNA-binding Zn-ribbon protein involved in translation (DUF1610 family)
MIASELPCPACGSDLRRAIRTRLINIRAAIIYSEPFYCPKCKEWLIVSSDWSAMYKRRRGAFGIAVMLGLLPSLILRGFGFFMIVNLLATLAVTFIANSLTLIYLRPKLEQHKPGLFELTRRA